MFILSTPSPRKLTHDSGRREAAPTGAAGVLDEDVEEKIVTGNIDTATTFFPILAAETRLVAGYHPCPHSNITPLTFLCIVVPHRSDAFFLSASFFLFWREEEAEPDVFLNSLISLSLLFKPSVPFGFWTPPVVFYQSQEQR